MSAPITDSSIVDRYLELGLRMGRHIDGFVDACARAKISLLAVDEAAQSLTFAGDTPQGHRVRLMKANFDRLVNGAGDAGGEDHVA